MKEQKNATWNTGRGCYEFCLNNPNFFDLEAIEKLDTPYYALKMQQDGVYEYYVTYRDELFEYEQEQKLIEQQRQEAYQQALEDNPDLTYEDWLSTQPHMMPVLEPQPSQTLLDFKKKYLG